MFLIYRLKSTVHLLLRYEASVCYVKSRFKYKHRVAHENSDGLKGTGPLTKRTCQKVVGFTVQLDST
jgi:hypothetical protein